MILVKGAHFSLVKPENIIIANGDMINWVRVDYRARCAGWDLRPRRGSGRPSMGQVQLSRKTLGPSTGISEGNRREWQSGAASRDWPWPRAPSSGPSSARTGTLARISGGPAAVARTAPPSWPLETGMPPIGAEMAIHPRAPVHRYCWID